MKTLIEITDKELGSRKFILDMVGFMHNRTYIFDVNSECVSLNGVYGWVHLSEYFNCLIRSKKLVKLEIHNFYTFKNKNHYCICRIKELGRREESKFTIEFIDRLWEKYH